LTTGDSARASVGKVLELDGPEAAVDLDVAASIRAGARGFRLRDAVRLSADEPRETLAFVRLLRDAASFGVPVAWHGIVDEGLDARLLIHLAPPGPVPEEHTSVSLAEWRHFHQPGLCYYRLGPGFVFIKDVRWEGQHAARYRFELDGIERIMAELETVVDAATLDDDARGALEDLKGEHLALRLGGLATLLPYRMRRWPVPALEI
jgi:hypothetical protein